MGPDRDEPSHDLKTSGKEKENQVFLAVAKHSRDTVSNQTHGTYRHDRSSLVLFKVLQLKSM